jgi:hypothetical protein
MHVFESGARRHATSPPPPELDAPDDPPELEAPDDPPLLDAPDDPPELEAPDDPPLLDAPDDPPLLELLLLELLELLLVFFAGGGGGTFSGGSVLLVFCPVPALSPSPMIGAGDAAHATKIAATAVTGIASARCFMGGSS